MNKILLKRKLKVILPPISKELGEKSYDTIIVAFLKNIESLGFTFSKDIIKKLPSYTKTELKKIQDELVINLKEMVGANVKYTPMYPNFPEQVAEASEAELYLNAIIHYIDGILLETPEPWLPKYETEKRPKLKDTRKLKIINLGTEEDFYSIFNNLFNSKIAWSPEDRKDIIYFINMFKGKAIDLLPEAIFNKENLAALISIFKEKQIMSDSLLKKYFKTATDVLRFITAISQGDVSLATNSRFSNTKRSDRKLFLSILELIGQNNIENLTEDMWRHREKWLRVGEKLHPGEYKRNYPLMFKAFDKIRNEKVETFNSKVEQYFKNEDDVSLIELLKLRPGEFARKLDRTLRYSKKVKTILKAFEEASTSVSNTVLLQVKTHFTSRNEEEYRAFCPKGVISRLFLVDNELPELKPEICKEVIDICDNALISSFKDKEKLGKVYIEEELKDCTIPLVLRDTNTSLKTISRGSKVSIPKGNTIRLFIHWKNVNSKLPSDDKGGTKRNSNFSYNYNEDREAGVRVDIDLSAVLFDKDFKRLEAISYMNLKSDEIEVYHSGDIVSAPRGASEFIDINISKAIKHKVRYIAMNVNMFTGQPFKNVPECYAGCMIRQAPNSGEIYDPKTVEHKFDLASDSQMCVPLIFDLEESQIIWCDMSINVNEYYANNIENNSTGVSAIGKALTQLSKPNLYDLFKLHAKARGTLVKEKSEADIVFGLNKGDVTAFDIEKIVSDYL